MNAWSKGDACFVRGIAGTVDSIEGDCVAVAHGDGRLLFAAVTELTREEGNDMTIPNAEETPKRARRNAAKTAATEPAPAEPTSESSGPAPLAEGAPTVTWNDIVAATAAKEVNRVEREIVEDVIEVALDERAVADIARANAADDEEKADRQRKVDELKSSLKDEKAALEAIDARMRDRHNAVRKGKQSRKAHWIVESIFASNTVRYLDPDTEAVVFERPMRSEERQTSLPLVSDDAASKAAQLALGDQAQDEDGTDVTDPEGILNGSAEEDSDEEDEDEA